MIRSFTLDFWLDDGWYVGRLREVPVCSVRAKVRRSRRRS